MHFQSVMSYTLKIYLAGILKFLEALKKYLRIAIC